ncbi:unnamed protein product [Prorocentrum cordatum]|uniref:Uncharacterized protein n=1 Tax=Prorocentrum cordatum TaxID=2364126 RepID=A0ABN9Q4F3_9DINO|nr:unnamed protein product [Polarella glacialis]
MDRSTFENVTERQTLEDCIGICFVISSVEDIDNVKETAAMVTDIAIFALKDTKAEDDEDGKKQIKEINKELFFVHAYDDWDEEITPITDEDLRDGVIAGEISLRLKVKVNMNCSAFPFDVQTLPILLYSGDDGRTLVSAEHFWIDGRWSGYARAVAITPTALISDEWDLTSAAAVYDKSDISETMYKQSQIGVYIALKRKGSGYFIRLVSANVMISAGAVLPYMMPSMEPTGIMEHQVGLLFAVVSFQLLLSSFLPPTSTMTVLDHYSIGLFCFIFLLMLLPAVEGYYQGPEVDTIDPEHSSFFFFHWSFSVWLVGHITFAARVV